VGEIGLKSHTLHERKMVGSRENPEELIDWKEGELCQKQRDKPGE
jgi:hypothetical protein